MGLEIINKQFKAEQRERDRMLIEGFGGWTPIRVIVDEVEERLRYEADALARVICEDNGL